MKRKVLYLAMLGLLALGAIPAKAGTVELDPLPLGASPSAEMLAAGGQTTGGTTPTYCYAVTAVDNLGLESVYSNAVCTTFAQGKHIAALTWTASVPNAATQETIVGYNINRGSVATGPFTKVNTSLVTAVTYSDTFVPPSAPSGLAVSQQ